MDMCAREGIDTFSHAHTNTHVVEHIHGCEHGRGNRYTFICPNRHGVEHAHGRLHERENRYPFIRTYKHTWGYFTTLTYTVMGAGQSRVYPAARDGGPQAGTNAAVLGKTFFFFREASGCVCVCVCVCEFFFFNFYWSIVAL